MMTARTEENKENKKGEQSKVVRIPIKIKIKLGVPTQIDVSTFPTQLSDGDYVTINLLEQELEELEAKSKLDDDMIKVMVKATAGYPDNKEIVMQEINPPQLEMGTVCVWCGEEPCKWTEVSEPIFDHYRVPGRIDWV
jgi:hypothetical protein